MDKHVEDTVFIVLFALHPFDDQLISPNEQKTRKYANFSSAFVFWLIQSFIWTSRRLFLLLAYQFRRKPSKRKIYANFLVYLNVRNFSEVDGLVWVKVLKISPGIDYTSIILTDANKQTRPWFAMRTANISTQENRKI